MAENIDDRTRHRLESFIDAGILDKCSLNNLMELRDKVDEQLSDLGV